MIDNVHSPSRWRDFFFRLCQVNAAMSKDPSTQVGAVIVRPNLTIAGMGWNGFPRGVEDSPQRLADREVKYGHIIHAEMNALLSTQEPLHDCTLYVWPMRPCDRCMAHIIQSGIRWIVTPPMPRHLVERWGKESSALDMAKEANINVVIYHPARMP